MTSAQRRGHGKADEGNGGCVIVTVGGPKVQEFCGRHVWKAPSAFFGVGSGTFWVWFSELSRNVFTKLCTMYTLVEESLAKPFTRKNPCGLCVSRRARPRTMGATFATRPLLTRARRQVEARYAMISHILRNHFKVTHWSSGQIDVWNIYHRPGQHVVQGNLIHCRDLN